MIIANPLYDVVFKSLMDDREIARGLISTIIGEEIVELEPRVRETPVQLDVSTHHVTIYRLDYVATVRRADGELRRIIVEVQKAKLGSEVRRFRNYLAQQYMRPDQIPDGEGGMMPVDPPIASVYILGFDLGTDIPAYTKVDRRFIDMLNEVEVQFENYFIEALTHQMYVLQTRKIKHQARNEIERLLAVFSQSDFADDKGHAIAFPDPLSKAKNKLLRRILRHLAKLTSEKEIRQRMQEEDDAYEELEAAIAAQKMEMKKKMEEERRQKEEALRQKEEERRQKEEALRQKEVERRQKQLLLELLRETGMDETRIKELLKDTKEDFHSSSQ